MQLYFVILSSMFVSRTYEIPSFVFVFSTSDKTPQDATRRHKYVFSGIVVISRNLLPKYLMLFYRTEAVWIKLLIEMKMKEIRKEISNKTHFDDI